MKRNDYLYLSILSVLAGFVWLRDRSWAATSSDVLPVLVALPLFVWLGWPWCLQKPTEPVSPGGLASAAGFWALGMAANLTFFLAVGWALSLWSWLAPRLRESAQSSLRRLLVLPVLAFPWIALDGAMVGWWFRLTGAAVSARVFLLLGFDVVHEGTNLQVQGCQIAVDAPCSGLNALQSMLIAGSALTYLALGQRPGYWWNLAGLVVLAWVANTARILLLTASVLMFGAKFTGGSFHELSGWLVLVLIFLLSWPILNWQIRRGVTAKGSR